MVGQLLVLRFHGREQEDFLDVIAIGQEHGEAVDSAAPAASGRQAVFEGGTEDFVNHLGFVVSGGLASVTKKRVGCVSVSFCPVFFVSGEKVVNEPCP